VVFSLNRAIELSWRTYGSLQTKQSMLDASASITFGPVTNELVFERNTSCHSQFQDRNFVPNRPTQLR
jgi:hypothetical protein